MTTARCAAGAALGLFFLTGTARADTTSRAAAEVLFHEGRTLYNDGKYGEACNRFARSEQLDPAVGTLLNLGDCYKHLGKTASAWLAYREAISLANARGDERRTTATEEAEKLETNLARVRIDFAGSIPGVTILLNGEAVDPSNFASPIPVDPGTENLEASAPGRKPWTTSVNVAAGATKAITVPVLESIHHPTASVATGLEVGGGVALAAAVTFGTIAFLRWSSVSDACPDLHCPNKKTLANQTSAADSAHLFGNLSTAAAIVGIAALGTGLYLDFVVGKRASVNVEASKIAFRATF
jgi:hypothetical protein